MSTINELSQTKPTNPFNLGFYFDFKMKNPKLIIHTGLMIKSSMGVQKIPTNSLNNPVFDNAFDSGSIEWKIKYSHLPIMIKYRFVDQFFIEDGLMTELRYMPCDEFTDKVFDKKDLD